MNEDQKPTDPEPEKILRMLRRQNRKLNIFMAVTSFWMIVTGGLEINREFTKPPKPTTTLVQPATGETLLETKKRPDDPAEETKPVEPFPADRPAIKTPAPTSPPAP